ncbi:MAG TPA: CHAT domain-containing protein, partial [Anaerolineae bacterium]
PAREEVQFDLSRLRALENRPEAYGSALTESLFVHPRQRLFFEQALSLVRRKQQRLRIRLQIDPGASELHALQWETLRGLEEDGFLTLTEGVYFMRFLTSPTWARIELRPMGDFRALLVFANPAGLTEDRLSTVEQARSSLGETPVTVLSAQFGNRPASLQNLVKSLSEAYDILYLDCHVAFVQDKPLLWFENDEGGVDVVAGSALVARLSELRWRPRLVVLANGQTEALAVLAPRLAEAGIMAVLAIQGNVGGTLPLFMTTFFKELWLDGQVDRAVAVARTSVGNRSGWWAPVLYQRGRDGKLWDAQK